MAASVFDSPLFTGLFPTGEAARLFSDSAATRAMLLVLGALAKAQGNLGVIPELSGAAIHRAAMEVQIDPGALAAATGQNGVPLPALVAAFRDEMQAPEHSQYIHWGATSQDIMDSGLMLRLRQFLNIAQADLNALIKTLGRAAQDHAQTPMPGRTYGQHATPTSWGAVLATWGNPLVDAAEALDDLRARCLFVSLSGAAGTGSALGPQAPQTRAALAGALGLGDPQRSWHTDRTPILRLADWQGQIMAPLQAMGASLSGLSATGIGEITLGAAGASSTMPQKQNPVAPAALQALAQQFTALRAGLQTSAAHMHQRDGAAWFTEWMILPQLCLSLAAALKIAGELAQNMAPNAAQMAGALQDNLGLIHAEALSFALAEQLPRPAAQAASKALCQEALQKRVALADLARAAHPGLPADLFTTDAVGHAPTEARAFAVRAAAL
ncbi:MAG: lyase family protein [Sulfitobacter sp.]